VPTDAEVRLRGSWSVRCRHVEGYEVGVQNRGRRYDVWEAVVGLLLTYRCRRETIVMKKPDFWDISQSFQWFTTDRSILS
jgi:hypothetical protein